MTLEKLYKTIDSNSIMAVEYKDIEGLTAFDISKIFSKYKIDCYVITKNKTPCNLFTPTDIIDIFVEHEENTKLSLYMEKHPKKIISFNKNEAIITSYNTARHLGIEHIVIVNDEDKLEAVVTPHDLAIFLSQVAMRDELTTLYNKRFFDFIKDKYQNDDSEFGVIFIDLDNFKTLNDTYGHLFGDKVLKRVADIIKKSIRDIDYAFRFGGDEFVVITFLDKSQTEKVAQRISEKISKAYMASVQISASIGYAHYKSDGNNIDEVMQKADEMMYDIKKSAKNSFRSHHMDQGV